MKTNKGLTVLLVGAFLSVLLMSCGGGGGSSSNTTDLPPTVVVQSAQDRTLVHIRAGMAAANVGNAASSAPLAPPSVWQPSTEYAQGQVVTGGGGDANYQYIAIFPSGFSSASGSGPTGTGDAPIVDGGVTWYYAGPVRTQVINALHPMITSGLKSSLLSGLTSYQTFTPTMAEPVVLLSGGLVEPNPHMDGIISIRGSNYTTSSSPAYGTTSTSSMVFWTDSSAIVLGSYNSVYKNHGLVVEVNDRLVDDSEYVVPVTVNPGAFKLDFGGDRSKKKIRLISSAGIEVTSHQIFIEQQARLWVESNPNHWRLAVEGDSLTQGGYYTPYHAGLDWVSQVGRLIGCDDVANMAQGGTGFLNRGNGKTTYMERVDRLASLNADVYLIAGNHNDAGYPAQDQVSAAFAYFQRLRELQPNALIIVAGTNPLQGESGGAGGVRDSELNLKAAFDQWADAHSYFIPIATAPDGPWITGTGAVDNPKGDGNKDHYYITIDGHPLQRGVDYLAQRYAQALRKILLPSGGQ